MNNKRIDGQKVGSVNISMYEEVETGLPFFYVKADNKHVLPLSRIIKHVLDQY